MKLEPAIEVRDEEGSLLGLIDECAVPKRRGDGYCWAVAVKTHEEPEYFELEYVRLEWARYRCGMCVYWAVRVDGEAWPQLVESSPWCRSTQLDWYPFTPFPGWAKLGQFVSLTLAGHFISRLKRSSA